MYVENKPRLFSTRVYVYEVVGIEHREREREWFTDACKGVHVSVWRSDGCVHDEV